MNTHGRALYTLVHRALAGYNEEEYHVCEGENLCSNGCRVELRRRPHARRMPDRSRCGFEPGDVTPVVLQLEEGPVELAPWTYCLGNGCADGAPPAGLHHVGSPGEVTFTFARDDWTFDATFKEHDDPCARMITVPVEKTGDQEFLIRPAGPAGDWDVDVFGRGNGDVITTGCRTVTVYVSVSVPLPLCALTTNW